jgi:N-acetylmuramoyl-L-alanine amidase
LQNSPLPLIQQPSPNFDQRRAPHIDHLVLHYTGMASGEAALARLTDGAAESRVSAHYLVEEDGRIFQLVEEAERAWHAGVAYWRGQDDLNSRSIGIEIVNPGHEYGYRAFPGPQIAAVIALCQDILARHPMPPVNILGHSDIAPWRKEDPGELFPWGQLAEAGIGLYPHLKMLTRLAFTDEAAAHWLHEIGYRLEAPSSLEATTTAFQRRFRPRILDGKLDAETLQLIRLYHRMVCQAE